MTTHDAGHERRFLAKPLAAAVGATLTAITSETTRRSAIIFHLTHFTPSVTPFDVIKTRLQTPPQLQASSPGPTKSPVPLLFPTPPRDACCQPSGDKCARLIHYTALSGPTPTTKWSSRPASSPQIVCLWDGQIYRNRPVNGFRDAAWQIWTVEGFTGLWKGVGTTL